MGGEYGVSYQMSGLIQAGIVMLLVDKKTIATDKKSQ